MKKFLLSLATLALAAGANATAYTVFDIANPGEWTGNADGWKNSVTVGGHTFDFDFEKAESTTDLISPVANTYAWRMYKKSKVTLSCADFSMKQVIITYDDMNNGQYCLEMTLSEGWTGVIDQATYTLLSSGLNSVTFAADNGQVRIKTIVVSDEEGEVTPELPEGIVYKNDFSSNLDGWVKINDESLSDFSGWKINNNSNSPKCAICNSYYGGENHAANAKMQYRLDLTNFENCKFSFEQAFGYDFPQAQNDKYRVYIIDESVNSVDPRYLEMTAFPAAPESGNWTKDWAENNFDISEYDGGIIWIGFEYANAGGNSSQAWELRNFVVEGDSTLGAVEGINAEENAAPVFYNLQGVRVNNPENGLFIVVKGSKSQKVLF